MKRNRKIHFRKKLIKTSSNFQYYINSHELWKTIEEFCISKNIKLKQCKMSIYSSLSWILVKCNKKQYDELYEFLNDLKCIDLC